MSTCIIFNVNVASRSYLNDDMLIVVWAVVVAAGVAVAAVVAAAAATAATAAVAAVVAAAAAAAAAGVSNYTSANPPTGTERDWIRLMSQWDEMSGSFLPAPSEILPAAEKRGGGTADVKSGSECVRTRWSSCNAVLFVQSLNPGKSMASDASATTFASSEMVTRVTPIRRPSAKQQEAW